ncbi:hypothetical protein GGR57DRAFT_516798 [Xylariaceae sp. FL1272]|nr:hypothetical protein GGR57DRAFT_516798 [Xylariaceae sp. FL1272]
MSTQVGIAPGRDRAGQRSPWAERFGTIVEPLFDEPNAVHSGISHVYPYLDPKYYGDIRSASLIPALSLFDQLKVGEKIQSIKNHGIQTYQIATLHKWLHFGNNNGQTIPLVPGGHEVYAAGCDAGEALYEQHIIETNETEWLDWFLQKNRWYNTEDWSIDDPHNWSALSKACALADRMIKSMIEEKHEALQTALFGRLSYWKQHRGDTPSSTSMVVFTPDYEREQSTVLPDFMNKKPREWLDKLHQLLADTTWCMGGARHPMLTSALTQGNNGIIWLHIEFGKVLRDTTTTLAERSICTFILAVTMVHEAMHALMWQRVNKDRQDASWQLLTAKQEKTGRRYPGGDILAEPIVDFESTTPEFGSAMEARMFGGTLSQTALVGHDNAHPPLGVWVCPQRTPLTYEHVQSLYTSHILCQSFWEDKSFRKSDHNFHHVPIFTTRGNPGEEELEIRHNSEGEFLGIDKHALLIQDWGERCQTWELDRQLWFTPLTRAWEVTPWSQVTLRAKLGYFELIFNGDDSEVPCASIAEQFVGQMDWDNPELFVAKMPDMNSPLRHEWYFYAIGLLMMAAMPLRNAGSEYREKVAFVTLLPGQEMQSTNPQKDLVQYRMNTEYLEETMPDCTTCSASILWTHRDGEIKALRGKNLTQLDYLQVLSEFMFYVEHNNRPISLPWYKAIAEAYKTIKEWRESMISPAGGNTRKTWVPHWPFKIPSYEDPHWGVRDVETSTWQALRWNDEEGRFERI